ncbi:MAG: hypothetical protein AABZ08_05510 [Planctomycetota bacterium]
MIQTKLQIALLPAVLVFVTACRSDSHTYVSPVKEEQICVTPVDLGVTHDQLPPSGAKELDKTPTIGRFPTGISVVRINAVTDSDSTTHHIQLASMTVERSAYWNQLLDDFPALREVTMHRMTGLDPRGIQHKALLKKSVQNDCGLCLIYARVKETDADAEYVGVIWDATTEKALTSYRIPVTIAECRREEVEDDSHPKPKHKVWLEEADFRAEADLRQLVRYSIWDMAQRDGFEPTTQPNPWQTDRPVYPRDSRLRILDLPTLRKGR